MRFAGWLFFFAVMGLAALLSFAGATVGGYAGWYIGKPFGFTMAFIVSMVGSGFGMYYGRQLAKRWS